MPDKKLPRGIRNNNPGNIRKNPANKWQGLAAEQSDVEFCTFETMAHGVRAMARLIIRYFDDYGCNTVEKVISRWAPENGDRNGAAPGGEYSQDTAAYIKRVVDHVSARLGKTMSKATELNFHDYFTLRAVVEVMITVEAGVPWDKYIDEAQLVKGLVMAGVSPPQKPLSKSRTIKGSQVNAGAGVITAATGTAVAIAPAVPVMQSFVEMVQNNLSGFLVLFGIIVVGAALYTAWARFDDRRKGVN